MMAPQGLLAETARVEANYAEVKRKIDELSCQYRAKEQQAQAELDEKLAAIAADFEAQRAEIAAQLGASIPASVVKVLTQKRDLEVEVLRRIHQEQADDRKRRYDEQKKQYDEELFAAITALMSTGSAPGKGKPPVFSRRPSDVPQSHTTATAAVVAASGEIGPAETDPLPPPAAEVPSQPQQVASLLPIKAPTETDSQSISSRNSDPDNVQPRSPQSLAVHSRDTPTASHQQAAIDDATPAGQSPAESASTPPPAFGHENPPSDPLPFAGQSDGRSTPQTLTSRPDTAQKRKANGESNGDSPALTPGRHKRTKLDRRTSDDSVSTGRPSGRPSPTAGQDAPERTVTFEEVYGAPGRPAPYKHVIVQYPSGSGVYYILRCDEHGVHFGEHPLRGAAKHLASAQHNWMSKEHATAIKTLGHRVLGCTEELAQMNNDVVLRAFKEGSYKIFNANNLSQTKRAELGYPPLDPLASQKAALHRKQTTGGVTNPVACRFYVGSSGGEVKCPVLILPWGDMSPAGLVGTLADTGLFRDATEDGKPLPVPKLPKCYVYHQLNGRVIGIRGWARGYEDGGPLEKKREFPVLCAESEDCGMWTVGWVKAAHLSPLNFDDPSSRNIPFFREARDYFFHRILRQRASRGDEGKPDRTASRGSLSTSGEDVEMKDAEDPRYLGRAGASDRGTVSRAMSESDNAGASMHPAQMIAAQALGLQPPARSGFRAINAATGADRSTSQSPRASPPPRAGSGLTTPGGHKRVIKIHAHSSNRHSSHTPSMVLPERPADATNLPSTAPSQPQGGVRKPSPASLQNILQDFPASTAASPRVDSQSPKPGSARRPLPSGPVRNASPSRSALLSAVTARLAQAPGDNRAGSAPEQLPQVRDPIAEEIRRVGSASAASGVSRHATPQPAVPAVVPGTASAPAPVSSSASAAPSASTNGTPQPSLAAVVPAPTSDPVPTSAPAPIPASTPRREPPPPPIQVPPPPTSFTPITLLNTTPLATPTASATNTRANSPAVQSQPTKPAGTPATTTLAAGFPRPETPTLTPTLAQQAGTGAGPAATAFLPTMDVFDLAGVMDGSVEVFRSPAPGQYLRLIDDHQSGVFSTASDAPVAVRIDPKRVKMVERVSVQGGAVCVVTVTLRQEPEEAAGGHGEERKLTLVLEKARSTASGMLNGFVHARRLCRRLQEWNAEIAFPSPGNDLSTVQWRFDSQTQTPTPTTAGVGKQEAK